VIVANRTRCCAQLGLGPDFDVSPANSRAQIDFIHRRT